MNFLGQAAHRIAIQIKGRLKAMCDNGYSGREEDRRTIRRIKKNRHLGESAACRIQDDP